MNEFDIRPVEQIDLPELLEIYNHYVLTTPVTFDIEPLSLSQRQEWLDKFSLTGSHRCFVAIRNGKPVGWATSSKFRDRPAYNITVETSVYLTPEETGKGLGRELYQTLFDSLSQENVHKALGGITLPNEASVKLHLSMGFKLVGVFHEIGFKFGRYWDVAWYERAMR
jgi:phosphinothricin acetyltransferase